MTDTGSWFPAPAEGDLPDDLRSLFATARERIGFVPNVFAGYASRPEQLRAQVLTDEERWDVTLRTVMATTMLADADHHARAR